MGAVAAPRARVSSTLLARARTHTRPFLALSQIDAAAAALNAAGAIIDSAPAAISKASHVLHQEAFAGLLDPAADTRSLLRRAATESGPSRTPGKGKQVASAVAAATAAAARAAPPAAAASAAAAAPTEARRGGGRPSVQAGTPRIIGKIRAGPRA